METNPYQPPVAEPEQTVAESVNDGSLSYHPAMWLVVLLAIYLGLGMIGAGGIVFPFVGGLMIMTAVCWIGFLASKST